MCRKVTKEQLLAPYNSLLDSCLGVYNNPESSKSTNIKTIGLYHLQSKHYYNGISTSLAKNIYERLRRTAQVYYYEYILYQNTLITERKKQEIEEYLNLVNDIYYTKYLADIEEDLEYQGISNE